MEDVLDISAREIATRIHRREVSVLALVEAHIARIERVDPALNAIVAGRYDDARRDALAVEARLANAPLGAPLPPLLGVPFTVQEAVGVAGLPHTGGSVYRWDQIATQDGQIVRRLKRAGALPIAVTNQPEAGLWVESKNLLYGRTCNPWAVEHTAGGASGGEAALIAAGGSPLGAGGGLISAVCIPAAFCGVPAHQPSARLIPAAEGWGDHLNCGLIARRVEDLQRLLPVLTGQTQLPQPTTTLAGMPVFVLEGCGGIEAAPVMTETVARAVESLIARGARVERLDDAGLDEAAAIWGAALIERSPEDFGELLGDGRSVPLLREALRFMLGQANHTSSALVLALVEALRRRLPNSRPAWIRAGHQLRDRLESRLAGGVILHPPYSRPAPRHRGTWTTPLDFLLSGLFDILGMPGTVVPMGFDGTGLPLSVQITASRGGDQRSLAVAAALEADFGGWVRAQPISLS